MTLSCARGGRGTSSLRRLPPVVLERRAVRVGPPFSSALALVRVLVRRVAGSFAPSSPSARFGAGFVFVSAAVLAVALVAGFRVRERVRGGRDVDLSAASAATSP